MTKALSILFLTVALTSPAAASPLVAPHRQFHRATFHVWPGERRHMVLAQNVASVQLTSIRVNGRHLSMGDIGSSSRVYMYGHGVAARFASPGTTVFGDFASVRSQRIRVTVRFFTTSS